MNKLRAVAVAAMLAGAAGTASAGIVFETTQATFASAVTGLNFLGTEDFESSTLADNQIEVFDDPLTPGVANGPFGAGWSVTNAVTVQSNTLAGAASSTSPRGVDGLTTASQGFAGTPDDQVSTNIVNDSFDVIVNSPVAEPIVAIGLRPLFFHSSVVNQTGTLTISVYDTLNVLLGSTSISGVEYQSETVFVGIVATAGSTIGRINLWDGDSDFHFQGADDIAVYAAAAPAPPPTPMPEPGTLLLGGLALAQIGLLARRRQRKSRAA